MADTPLPQPQTGVDGTVPDTANDLESKAFGASCVILVLSALTVFAYAAMKEQRRQRAMAATETAGGATEGGGPRENSGGKGADAGPSTAPRHI